MFIETTVHHSDKRAGWIEVITGSMFSGKTEELIRRLKRANIARQRVVIFKPKTDTRYSEQDVVSHDANALCSIPVDNSEQILTRVADMQVVGIDEAQFFDMGLIEVCNKLASSGIRIIVAGLDMDFRGIPFGPVPNLLAIAEYVTKVHAICMQCGNIAQYSHRKSDLTSQIILGAKDVYEPLCRTCFIKATGLIH